MVVTTRSRSRGRRLDDPLEEEAPAAATKIAAAQSLANLAPNGIDLEPDGAFNIRRVKSLQTGLERGVDTAVAMETGGDDVVGDGEIGAAAASIRGAAERIGGAAADLNGAATRLSRIDLAGGAAASPRTAMVAASTSTTSGTAPTTMAMAVVMASQAEAPPTVAAISAPIATSNMAPVAPSEAPTGEPTTPSTLGAMGFTLPPAMGDVQHSFMKGFFQRKTKVSNNLVVKNAAVMLQQNTPTHFQFINREFARGL